MFFCYGSTHVLKISHLVFGPVTAQIACAKNEIHPSWLVMVYEHAISGINIKIDLRLSLYFVLKFWLSEMRSFQEN